MPPPKPLLLRLTLIVFSIGIAVLATEFALRHYFRALPQLELDLYQRDEDGNLRLRPDTERRHVTRLWDVHIRINSEGWRDNEPKPDEARTVLALGDSMAFGWGVELEDSYLSQLEQQQKTSIVKAAVPGTGPTDQLKLLQTLWAQYQPKIVILNFFVGNDFVDVQMGGADQFDVEDGLLVRRSLDDKPSWFLNAKAKLIRTSRVLQLARALQLNWTRPAPEGQPTEPRNWDEWLKEFAQIHRKEYPPRTQTAVDDTLNALDAIHAVCREHNARMVLVVIPRSVQIDSDEEQEMSAALKLTENDLDLDRPQRLLNEWAAGQGIEAIDLLPTFREAHRENPKTNLYHTPDAHLNQQGHHIAAKTIAARLNANF